MMMYNNNGPIFIGGTGRSGTTIMGNFLNSHKDIVVSCHENKMIIEEFGFRSLVENLSAGYDYKGNHYAIKNFIEWLEVLRKPGFRDAQVSFIFRVTNKISRILFRRNILSAERICRIVPFLDFTLASVGDKFGLEHYDSCIESFLFEILEQKDNHGIFDTEGLLKPVYSASTFERKQLFAIVRGFLEKLYEKSVSEAEALRWCDDTPMNITHAQFLFELYPNCRIVHMVRDPRDVLVSYLERSWASTEFEFTLRRLKRHYETLIDVECKMPSEVLQRFTLEDFVRDHSGQRKRLTNFLKIDDDGFDGSIKLDGASLGRWKTQLSHERILRAEVELGSAISYFGYTG